MLRSDLPSIARFVGDLISHRVPPTGDGMMPSIAELEEETAFTRSTVFKALRRLRDDGWLARDAVESAVQTLVIPAHQESFEDPRKYHETDPLGTRKSARRTLGDESPRDGPLEREKVRETDPDEFSDPSSDRRIEDQSSIRARAREERTAAHQEMFATFVEVLGFAPRGRSESGAWGRTARSLVLDGVSPDEFRIAAERYERMWPNVERTPMAVYAHLGRMLGGPSGNGKRNASQETVDEQLDRLGLLQGEEDET